MDEIEISVYFIGEIAKHASFGGRNMCTLFSSGHPQETLNSSWAPFSGIEGSVLPSKQEPSVPTEELLDDTTCCYNALAIHELQCFFTANVFFFTVFSISKCLFTCSISVLTELATSMQILDHCNIAFLVTSALCAGSHCKIHNKWN